MLVSQMAHIVIMKSIKVSFGKIGEEGRTRKSWIGGIMTTDEKIGEVRTLMERMKGDIKRLMDAVFGNGVPGHEKRIGELEKEWSQRRKTCPFISDKQNRQIIIGLWINGGMMLTGFIALIVTLR